MVLSFERLKEKWKLGAVSESRLHEVAVGVELTEEGIGYASVLLKEGQLQLESCGFNHVTHQAERIKLLSEIVKNEGLLGNKCNLVLHPSFYKLLLVEAPDVSAERLISLIPEKVQDLIPWSIAETVTDIFYLPEDAYRGRKKMVYVAATLKLTVMKAISMISMVGLVPNIVDIQELVIRNALLIEDRFHAIKEESHAILRLKEKESVLLLMHGKQIYLTRRIMVSLSDLASDREGFLERLVNEIQRSLDYYDSQLGKGAVTRLAILPTSVDMEAGTEYLDSKLAAKVVELNVYDLLALERPIELQERGVCLPAIGAAVRGFVDNDTES